MSSGLGAEKSNGFSAAEPTVEEEAPSAKTCDSPDALVAADSSTSSASEKRRESSRVLKAAELPFARLRGRVLGETVAPVKYAGAGCTGSSGVRPSGASMCASVEHSVARSDSGKGGMSAGRLMSWSGRMVAASKCTPDSGTGCTAAGATARELTSVVARMCELGGSPFGKAAAAALVAGTAVGGMLAVGSAEKTPTLPLPTLAVPAAPSGGNEAMSPRAPTNIGDADLLCAALDGPAEAVRLGGELLRRLEGNEPDEEGEGEGKPNEGAGKESDEDGE